MNLQIQYNPYQNPWPFLQKRKADLKFIWNCKGPLISKTFWRKMRKDGKLILSNFKIYYKVTVIKTLWYQHKDKHIDKCNRKWEPRNKPIHLLSVNFKKGAKTLGKRIVSSANDARKTGYSHVKYPYLTPY